MSDGGVPGGMATRKSPRIRTSDASGCNRHGICQKELLAGADGKRTADTMQDDPDYYEILGVLRTAKSADITAAYHTLARKYHPDVGPTDSDSSARFKMISQAYDVLSDDEKRRAYDQRRQARTPARRRSADQCIVPVQPLFADPLLRPRGMPAGPRDIEADLPISPEESLQGGQCDFTVHIEGPCDACRVGPLGEGDICAACQGTGRVQQRHRLQITLPRGLQSGSVIRITGHGKRTNRAVGDLLLRIRIQPYW
jgi:molecular chaperone DnaJ